jgi:hypothetical protein
LYQELIQKKRRILTKFYWVGGTILVGVGIVETLVQFGVIHIAWFK